VNDQTPVLDVLLARDRDAWRLYVAPGWCPPSLQQHLDADGEAYPVAEPDLEALDRAMFAADAPYEKREGRAGVELLGRGRSAEALGDWLARAVFAQK